MKVFPCEQCGQDMILEKRLKNTKSNRSGNSFRVRRFKCSNKACDHKETIFADGMRDKIEEPFHAKEEVEKIYKQQEEARE